MRLLDLFAGIGGFSLAAHWAGWTTEAFCERDAFCQKVLRKNFGPDIEIYDDVRTFPGHAFRGRIDVISGGFPCQPFSMAGARRGRLTPKKALMEAWASRKYNSVSQDVIDQLLRWQSKRISFRKVKK